MQDPQHSPLSFAPLLQRVTAALPPDQVVYLVGGAVRDAMLGRETHDLDFALLRGALRTARRVADALGGAYYPLDVTHPTGRVVLQDDSGVRLCLDFADLRGPDLAADLQGRDFTINALALDARDPSRLIDPLGGLAALRGKRLEACSPRSFEDDPLRVLRAARMATAFDLTIPGDTLTWLRAGVPSLRDVSAERVRDELFRILEGRRTATALQLLDAWGALKIVLPELEELRGLEQPPPHTADGWTHTLRTVRRLEGVLRVLKPVHDEEASAELALGLMVGLLGRYREQISAHLAERFNPDRPLRPLLFLAALYHDVGKPETAERDEGGRLRFFGHAQAGARQAEARARRLKLSNQERSRLGTIVRHHMRPLQLAKDGHPPTRRAVYRYFRDTGAAGVDIALLSLADTLATYGASLPPQVWADHVAVVRALLEGWWEDRVGVVDPPALISGRDLSGQLDMPPGPAMGRLLAAIREAQAMGQIQDREGAMEFAREWLKVQDSGQG